MLYCILFVTHLPDRQVRPGFECRPPCPERLANQTRHKKCGEWRRWEAGAFREHRQREDSDRCQDTVYRYIYLLICVLVLVVFGGGVGISWYC